MQNLLDILGSTIIGLYFVYMILNFNFKMSDSLYDSVINNITELDAIELGKLLDYDLNKIGYRTDQDDLFSVAKVDELRFWSDLNNDGSLDSVYYKLGTPDDALETVNPDDMPLYRIINNIDTTINLVTNFAFAYNDSSGAEITPISQFNSHVKRRLIKGISVDFKIGSPILINNEYQFVEWKKKFTPRNIN